MIKDMDIIDVVKKGTPIEQKELMAEFHTFELDGTVPDRFKYDARVPQEYQTALHLMNWSNGKLVERLFTKLFADVFCVHTKEDLDGISYSHIKGITDYETDDGRQFELKFCKHIYNIPQGIEVKEDHYHHNADIILYLWVYMNEEIRYREFIDTGKKWYDCTEGKIKGKMASEFIKEYKANEITLDEIKTLLKECYDIDYSSFSEYL